MQMHHRKYENSRSVDTVEQAVREPARDGSPDAAVNDLMLQRVPSNPVEKHVDLVQEGTAEPMALSFVPAGRLPDVRLRLAPDGQPIRHRSRKRSSRAASHSSTSAGCS